MNGLEYRERRDGATATICLSGALDEESARQVEPQVLGAVEDDAVDDLRLDLGGITFVDSTGLGLLVRIARRAIRHEKDFSVVALSEVIEAQFERARLRALLVGDAPPAADEV